MAPRFIEIAADDRSAFQHQVADLERGVTYPLGNDRFEIDHGEDYFAFFDRLGEVRFFAALDEDEVIAVVAAVLRRLPFDNETRATWYFCDLKIRKTSRIRKAASQLLAHVFPRLKSQCSRGYAISMNPGDSGANPVARLLMRLPGIQLTNAVNLDLYSLSAEEMRAVAPALQSTSGPISYLSLAGKKDIVLKSTSAPMPLLHVQFGACAEVGHVEPKSGHTHMFCKLRRKFQSDTPSDALSRALHALELFPSSSATVLQHGMDRCDWRFVLTSDI